MNQQDSLAFTGIGMVTSLGADVVTSCAAARAGLSRLQEMEDFPVRSLQDGLVSGLGAHAAALVTRGFEGFARLVRLAHAGLRDLLGQLDPSYWQGRRTACYLSLPSPLRTFAGSAWLDDESTRAAWAEQRREAEGAAGAAGAAAASLLAKAGALAGFAGDTSPRFVTHAGRTGVAEALQRAWADLSSNLIDVAVIGAIDTLLEEDTLRWLAETKRLKDANHPVGVLPGEGAAFLAVELASAARRRALRPLGLLEAFGTGHEPHPWVSGETPLGDGLAQAILSARGAEAPAEAPWLVSDHAGDAYSVSDWGHALSRLTTKDATFAKLDVWYPAISFGDTDAAYGAIATCMVLRGFQRAYAPAGRAVIAAAALDSARAAFRVARQGEA